MIENIKPIKSLKINYNNFFLIIQSIQNEENNQEIYEISKDTNEWSRIGSSDSNQTHYLLSKEDIYNNSKRLGIWLSDKPSKIFSRVSIFEHIPYTLKFFEKEISENNASQDGTKNIKENLISEKIEILDVSREDLTDYLEIFFENPKLWYESIETEKLDGIWLINFREYIGKLKLKRVIINDSANDIEVIPRKITKKNYTSMLKSLDSFMGQTFFKYKTPTEVTAKREYIPTVLERLDMFDYPTFLLLNNIMSELENYFSGLKLRLNTKFFFPDEIIESYKVSDFSNINLFQTLSNPSNLIVYEEKEKSNILTFPFNFREITFNSFVITPKKLSYDTVENQFVKFLLKQLLYELDRIEIQKIFEDFKEPETLEEYRLNLAEKIYYLERLDIKDLSQVPYNSQLLQKDSYYRTFLQYFIWLQNPMIFNPDDIFSIDVKPVDRLYEYYCLFIMKSALDLIVGDNSDLLYYPDIPTKHITILDNPNVSEYRAIDCIAFTYKNKNGKDLVLIYKPKNYPLFESEDSILKSYSGSRSPQDPDFLLVELNNGEVSKYYKKNLMIVFDSKYRKESGDLWYKMHFYKDALNALGAVFINPYIDKKDNNYSGKIFTPYGELTENLQLEAESINYGFVSGINLLGLRNNNNEIEKFKILFENIIGIYFK